MKVNNASLEALKDEFRTLLDREDRIGCIQFALTGLGDGRFDIPTLYAGIAGPVLSESESCGLNDHACIWREHVKSAILRSVIECCYPHVMGEAEKAEAKGASVLILCPEKEYHELGARMVTDFFLLNGWNAHFAGANTPRDQIRAAVLAEHPAIVAVSVSDFYNLVEAEKAISGIRALLDEMGWQSTRIFVGGSAFMNNPDMYRQIGANGLLATYEDIRQLQPGGNTVVRTAPAASAASPQKPTEGGHAT